MRPLKALVIFILGAVVGMGAIVTIHRLHNHIDFARSAQSLKAHIAFALDRALGGKVRAAKLEHVVAPAAYFPAGSIWTQDISHAPLDPQSSTIIAWLEGAGGWGHNNKVQVDFAIRVLQANASTPRVPFRKAPGFGAADSDVISTIPLPAGGGIEGQTGYQCPGDDNDCHLIVVDRSQGKLYEVYHANYADGALSAIGLAVWDLNRIYPPSGRGRSMLQYRRRRLPDRATALQCRRTRYRKHQPRHPLYSPQSADSRARFCASCHACRCSARAD